MGEYIEGFSSCFRMNVLGLREREREEGGTDASRDFLPSTNTDGRN